MNRYGKKDSWAENAEIGKAFLEKYCTDTDGRMFFQVTRDGRPLRKRRYMFSESFFAVSMAEYAVAAGDKDALRKAEECFDMMLRLYRTPESDPYKITPKTYASTRADRASAVPMVLVSGAQVLRRCDPSKADYYSAVTREMADDIIKYHYKPERKCVLECVGPNGEFIDTPAGRCINPGHSMENSWFLMNEAVYSGNGELLEKALNILDWSLEIGWDKQFGGFVYFADTNGRPCEQLEWDMKLWWVHNEALIATLLAYGLTGDKKYFDWFEKSARILVRSFCRQGMRRMVRISPQRRHGLAHTEGLDVEGSVPPSPLPDELRKDTFAACRRQKNGDIAVKRPYSNTGGAFFRPYFSFSGQKKAKKGLDFNIFFVIKFISFGAIERSGNTHIALRTQGAPFDTAFFACANPKARWRGNPKERKCYGSYHHEAASRSRRPLRTPDEKMEPQDGRVYLHGKKRHLHHRPSEDGQKGRGSVHVRAQRRHGKAARYSL